MFSCRFLAIFILSLNLCANQSTLKSPVLSLSKERGLWELIALGVQDPLLRKHLNSAKAMKDLLNRIKRYSSKKNRGKLSLSQEKSFQDYFLYLYYLQKKWVGSSSKERPNIKNKIKKVIHRILSISSPLLKIKSGEDISANKLYRVYASLFSYDFLNKQLKNFSHKISLRSLSLL